MNIFSRYINNKNGMANLQTMVIVSTFLFIYEISLYYFNVIPTIRRIIKKELKADLIADIPLNNNIPLDILEVLKDRENILTTKINNYTIASAILFLLLLFLLIYLLHKKQSINIYVIMMSSIILVLIFGFQYLFYLFGKKYKYISSISKDEVNYLVLKSL
jgi:hypothetical protein